MVGVLGDARRPERRTLVCPTSWAHGARRGPPARNVEHRSVGVDEESGERGRHSDGPACASRPQRYFLPPPLHPARAPRQARPRAPPSAPAVPTAPASARPPAAARHGRGGSFSTRLLLPLLAYARNGGRWPTRYLCSPYYPVCLYPASGEREVATMGNGWEGWLGCWVFLVMAWLQSFPGGGCVCGGFFGFALHTRVVRDCCHVSVFCVLPPIACLVFPA
jgi:hypothetical protein